MISLRRWVWPGLKFLVVAAVAVALVRLAFFAAEPPGPETVPTGKRQEPTVTVATGNITNDVQAKGSIRSVKSVPVRATATGTVNRLFIANGAHVEQGAAIADVRVETPVEGTKDDGTPLPPKVTFATVVAPAAGTVSGLDLVQKQPIEIGAVMARVAPESYRASATLGAAQLYRLVQRPTEAQVTVKDGPAPFTCTGLTLTSVDGTYRAEGDQATGSDAGADSAKAGTRLECDVPADVTVFPGLEATISVPAGSAKGVLVVPTTAVEGTAQKGVVTVVGKGGQQEQREVGLGLSDGEQVEVTSNLTAGERVLQFIPGKEKPKDESAPSDGVQFR